jgi:hypothetical protein
VGPRTLNTELEMCAAWTVTDWDTFARQERAGILEYDAGLPSPTLSLKARITATLALIRG